jgi:hypothetical protein
VECFLLVASMRYGPSKQGINLAPRSESVCAPQNVVEPPGLFAFKWRQTRRAAGCLPWSVDAAHHICTSVGVACKRHFSTVSDAFLDALAFSYGSERWRTQGSSGPAEHFLSAHSMQEATGEKSEPLFLAIMLVVPSVMRFV